MTALQFSLFMNRYYLGQGYFICLFSAFKYIHYFFAGSTFYLTKRKVFVKDYFKICMLESNIPEFNFWFWHLSSKFHTLNMYTSLSQNFLFKKP